jgi:D-arabinose 1-dehydrogenase-like Zn-dependent alcohol dehydrogenase
MAAQNLPKTMRAHVLEQYETPYRIRELPIPTINDPNDLLVKVDAAPYCHTDAVLALGKMHPPPLPHVGCHEFAGTVVRIAEQPYGLKVGDRVAVPGRGYHVCGTCVECRNPSGPLLDDPGYSVYCPNSEGSLGIGAKPGGFQEYVAVDSRQVALIPAGMTAIEVAPLMCAGLTIYAVLKKSELEPGQRVGIVGCGGGLGHLGLQFATRMGLKTTGVDVAPPALELAKGLRTGATIINASTESAQDVRQKMGMEYGH